MIHHQPHVIQSISRQFSNITPFVSRSHTSAVNKSQSKPLKKVRSKDRIPKHIQERLALKLAGNGNEMSATKKATEMLESANVDTFKPQGNDQKFIEDIIFTSRAQKVSDNHAG